MGRMFSCWKAPSLFITEFACYRHRALYPEWGGRTYEHLVVPVETVAEVEMKFKDDLIDDLLNAKIESLQSVYQRVNLIGWDLNKTYVVVLLRLQIP
ncbi:hypothetical protein [Paenibacillus popilliae]|uniref:Regulator n=1 Tax=Paenibacillus popilliae ATCC 14706 TaxID=1212764 RepID=M9LZX6_PAEPP|nr:hypothetical protein [Paenibacillus popilliae]GAC41964.1 regulator [Paenibacillus popilliae ATCC 14706]